MDADAPGTIIPVAIQEENVMSGESSKNEQPIQHNVTEPDRERTGSRVADVATSAALGAAAAGAVVGAVAGPVGAAVGAIVGGVAAGFAGNEIADSVDRGIEEAYWQEQFRARPYVDAGATFDDYGPAYGYGVDGFINNQDRTFEDAEQNLSREWLDARGKSKLDWARARHASRDAWERVTQSTESKRR